MDEEKTSWYDSKFLNEPAWRWAVAFIVASIFLFVWGRTLNFLAGGRDA